MKCITSLDNEHVGAALVVITMLALNTFPQAIKFLA
jgi:hypothetical protein